MQASTIRAGILGLRRGLNLARQAQAASFEVVAVCDQDKTLLDKASSQARTLKISRPSSSRISTRSCSPTTLTSTHHSPQKSPPVLALAKQGSAYSVRGVNEPEPVCF